MNDGVCSLSDGEQGSVVVLNSDSDNGVYTLSGLSANTTYTLSVAAVSVAGQSETVLIKNVTTSHDASVFTVGLIVAIAVSPVLIVLALIGVVTGIKYV